MSMVVKDITRAAPTIIRILAHDEEFTRYRYVYLEEPDPSHPTASWVQRTNPNTGQLEYCHIVGDGTILAFAPKVPTNFLDRDAADIYTNYPSLGGVAPIAVYRKSYAHNQGSAQSGNSSNFRHELFVEYASTVPEGTYNMAVTGDFIPATIFSVVDKEIRSDTIRATQVGHKPSDPEKMAAMSVWIPERGSAHGAVDLDNEFSLVGQNFHLIKEDGTIAFTGTIALRLAPTTQEGSGTIALTEYPSTTTAPKVATGQVIRGNPTVIPMTAHGYTTGQRKYFSGFSGLNNQFLGNVYEITVIDSNSFSVAVDSTNFSAHNFGTYLTGWDSQVYEVHSANKSGTYVYDLDYSAFVPTADNYGKYRVYVPGFGVSWPFDIDPAVRYNIVKNSIKGYISQCWGMPVTYGEAGWDRPAQFRDGKNNQNVFASVKPGSFDSEGGYVAGFGEYLHYDAETGAFTAGLTVTGGTSGATGIIAAIDDNGATGALILRSVSGTFVDNEAITDTSTGSATVNKDAASLKFDAETGAFTSSLTVTGGTSGATGVIDSIEDNGTTGVLVLSSVSGTFVDNEVITDTSTGSATTDIPSGIDYIPQIRDGGMPTQWRTTDRVTDWFGAWSDAGDWDFHLFRHLGSLYNLLDMAYEFVPASQRNLHYGFPKSSTTIDKDLYGPIDGLGDAIHMVIWYLEPFRRHQHADGWVYSGCQYSTGAEGNPHEASWISTADMYLLAADHFSGFYYAWVAAKLGRLIKEAGFTTLGDMWIDSAEACFNWCNTIWTDWDTNGIASVGAWRDHYITNLNVLTAGGLSIAELALNSDQMNRWVNDKGSQTRGIRLVAATTLWRAKGGLDDVYNGYILAAGFIQNSGIDMFAMWEYLQGPDLGDNAAVRADRINNFHTRTDQLYQYQVADSFCYKNTATDSSTDNVQPAPPGNRFFWPWYLQKPAGDFTKYLLTLCSGEDYVLGKNQQGMSFTTGLGFNPPDPILVRDQEDAGIPPPPGFTIYVRGGPVGIIDFHIITGYIKAWPTTTQEVTQSFYPLYQAFPIYEQHIRNTFSIYSTEFVTQEQLIGRICNNIFLHTYDELGTTKLANEPISVNLSV